MITKPRIMLIHEIAIAVSLTSLAFTGCDDTRDEHADGGTHAPACAVNHGDCDPAATCTERGTSGRVCICLPWYSGDGVTCRRNGLAESAAWPMEGATVWHTGQSPYVGAQTGALKGKAKLAGWYRSAPVIGPNGVLYVEDADGFKAFDAGRVAANPSTPAWLLPVEQMDSYTPFSSSPALAANGLIYRPGYQRLSAIEPSTPPRLKVTFTTTIGNGLVECSSPTVGPDGTLYFIAKTIVGSSSDVVWNLFAVNPATLTEKWHMPTGLFAGPAPTIAGDGSILVGTDKGAILAFDASGGQKWSLAAGTDISVSPAIGADGTIFVAAGQTDQTVKLLALDPTASDANRVKWSWTSPAGAGWSKALAIGADGVAFVGDGPNGNLYAVDTSASATERLKWMFHAGDRVQSSPAIGADGVVYVGTDDQNVYAIGTDGREKWHYRTEGWVRLTPVIGADGTVYVAGQDGYLYAFGP